jgi:SH3-like domain-containing protein
LRRAPAKGPSGLPLPRFVSLKATRVNLRVGPGRDYAVAWLYTKPGVPMEVIQEYDNWRRVRDAEGTEGWVYQSLLSGERTAMAAPWKIGDGQDNYINMHREARANARIVARLEPGVVVEVKTCDGEWCEASADGVSGYVTQGEIWGAYPGEAFN